ncbi:MAG: glycosyltransferase family 2 protein, partial [bacterium]
NEIIIIDSGSTDGTLDMLRKFEGELLVRIVKIKKESFNHGDTRNLGVKLAKGKYICFFSQDVFPTRRKLFAYFLEDLKGKSDVVAVFGKNIPHPNTSLVNKIEHSSRWVRIDKFTDKKGVLVQSLKSPFMPYIPQNYLLWYFFGDTASCFKRSFLVKHPFPHVSYGEDIMMGKIIIQLGLSKIYDTRCLVLHSHEYSFKSYYEKQKESLHLRYNVLRLNDEVQVINKLRTIIKLDISFFSKVSNVSQLLFTYMIKGFIYIQLNLSQNLKRSTELKKSEIAITD